MECDRMIVVFEQVLVLFLFAAVGFALTRCGVIDGAHGGLLSKLLVYVFLPCNVFKTFATRFTVAYLTEHGVEMLISLAVLIAVAVTAHFAGRLLGRERYEGQVYEYSMVVGEPFDNYENVMKSIDIINHPKGLNIGARHISISTSGIVPKIYQLADEKRQCTLSISLHSSNNEKRSEMMPVNNVYPIEELIKACKYYIEKTNKRISFEYALAKGNNDNLEDAKKLVKLLKGMLAHVNLIPINKIESGKFTKSTNENIIKFRDYLNDNGITATIRRELGADIEAACGQLRRKNISNK